MEGEKFMKNVLIGFLVFGTISAIAANSASLEYSCQLDGVTKAGKVEINSELIVGAASCMNFEKGPTLCLRFERHVRINNINLALRNSDQLRTDLDSNFIALTNVPYSEGSTSINTVKVSRLKKEDLTCTYSNINWKN